MNYENKRTIDIRDWDKNVFIQLVNTRQNEDLLRRAPSREVEDLSVIYRWLLDIEGEKVTSTIINNDLFSRLDISEESLYRKALENTRILFPPTIKDMNEFISFITRADDKSLMEDIVKAREEGLFDEKALYLITNNIGTNGAASLLYDEELFALASAIDSDLYIMPSSIHELIAVSTKLGEVNELANMVRDINMEAVALEDRLSNQVYHYDKDLRKLSMATNTIYQRLDGRDVTRDIERIR